MCWRGYLTRLLLPGNQRGWTERPAYAFVMFHTCHTGHTLHPGSRLRGLAWRKRARGPVHTALSKLGDCLPSVGTFISFAQRCWKDLPPWSAVCMTYQVLLLPSRLGSAKPSVNPFVCKSRVASSSSWRYSLLGDTLLLLYFGLFLS